MATCRNDFRFKCAGLRCRPCASVGTRGELVLHFPADAVQARQHFGGQPHHTGRFCHITAQTRVKIHAVAHRDVAHMLHAANQADAGVAGHDHARRIVQRLHR